MVPPFQQGLIHIEYLMLSKKMYSFCTRYHLQAVLKWTAVGCKNTMKPEKMEINERPARIRKPEYAAEELMPLIEFTLLYYNGP